MREVKADPVLKQAGAITEDGDVVLASDLIVLKIFSFHMHIVELHFKVLSEYTKKTKQNKNVMHTHIYIKERDL